MGSPDLVVLERTLMPSLFDPIRLGAIAAPNRIIMAPLTRGRATREHVPTPLMAEYYAQRAGAGLIISEATGISQQGLGWPYAPGLWNAEQVAAWRPVTTAVHEAGGALRPSFGTWGSWCTRTSWAVSSRSPRRPPRRRTRLTPMVARSRITSTGAAAG